MSRWLHVICDTCWRKLSDREPVRMKVDFEEHHSDMPACCWCGLPTLSGIFKRHDPDDPELKCHGVHDDDA